jgi:hypothetical protein
MAAEPGSPGTDHGSAAGGGNTAGGGSPADRGSPADGALTVRAARPRSPRAWVASAVVAALVLAGGGLWYATAGHRSGGLVLPGRLLGQAKVTGPQAQIMESRIRAEALASSHGYLTDPVAAVYRGPGGQYLEVLTADACTGGTCVALTARQYVAQLRAAGHANARSFAPGSGGILLACYSERLQQAQLTAVVSAPDASVSHRAQRAAAAGQLAFVCTWLDHSYVGEAMFGGGSAATMGDAASMTRQIRAAIEH